MKNALVTLLNRKTRIWAYGVSVAVCGYLGVRGVIDSNEILYLNFLFAAIFGVAIANVPTKDTLDPPPSSVADKATSV